MGNENSESSYIEIPEIFIKEFNDNDMDKNKRSLIRGIQRFSQASYELMDNVKTKDMEKASLLLQQSLEQAITAITNKSPYQP